MKKEFVFMRKRKKERESCKKSIKLELKDRKNEQKRKDED